MTSQAPVMRPFSARFKTAMRKFEFYPMKKDGLHGRINEKPTRLSFSRGLHESSSIRAHIAFNHIHFAR
jgi:hypothetical protein